MSEPVPFFLAQCDDAGKVTWERASQVSGYLRKKFAGKTIEVEFREYRDKRSDRQNRGFHAMVSPWAKDEGWRVDDLKLALLKTIFGTHEFTNPATGEIEAALNEPHTSHLNIAQFSELIERTLDIAAETGYVLQSPDEYKRQQEQKRQRAAKQAAKAAKVGEQGASA